MSLGINENLLIQAYKMFDNGLYTMLPGWAPQIGQLPPRQNKEVIQEQLKDKLRRQNNSDSIDPNMTNIAPYSPRMNDGQSPVISSKALQNEYKVILTILQKRSNPYEGSIEQFDLTESPKLRIVLEDR